MENRQVRTSRLRKLVYMVLSAAVLCCLALNDLPILPAQDAHARGQGMTCERNNNKISPVGPATRRVQWTGNGSAGASPPEFVLDEPWSADVRVNDDAGTAWQAAPSIAVDAKGNAYAAWWDLRDGWIDAHITPWYTAYGDIYFSLRSAGGSWGPNVRINDEPGAACRDRAGLMIDPLTAVIAVDPAGNAHAAWTDCRDGSENIYYSFRPTGGSWEPNVRVNESDWAYGPAIAVDDEGNVYAVWRGGDIYFSYRRAGGSWGPNVTLTDQSGVHGAQNPDIAVDPSGNAYAVWVGYGEDGVDIYFSYRPTGGNWGPNVRVSDRAAAPFRPAIAVDHSGNAYAVWDDTGDIYFSSRPVSGGWGSNLKLNDRAGVASSPAVAVDAAGNAYAVWGDWRADGPGIYFSCRSSDGSWSTNVRVNDDIEMVGQASPSIGVDPSGNAYAAWEDSLNGNTDVYFSYRQPAPHADPSELLQQKHSTIQSLSQVGYDEQPSRGLVGTLEAEAAEGWLPSPSEFSAVQRLVLTEELLAKMYPHYARSSADTGEALTSFLFIMLGFWKALDTVETNLPDSIFSGAAKALIAKIKNKLIDLINHMLEFIEYRYIPHDFRPTFHNLRQVLWAYAKAHIMDPDDPLGPGGEALMTTLADPELAISRDNVLLDHYRDQTQPCIEVAVKTADPDYAGPDRFDVHPTDEGAKLQMEWVINQVEIWSDQHHATHEDLKRGANVAALAADIADLASLTGVLAPMAQAVARAADGMDVVLAFLRGGQSFLFLVCLQQSAQDGQVRIYDPSTGLEMPPACEMSKRLGLLGSLKAPGAGAYLPLQLHNQMELESEEYQELLQGVVAALEQKDRDTLAELVPELLEADDELSRAIDLTDAAILATADEQTSEGFFLQGAAFDLATITLYAYLVDALLVPEEASLTAARNQALTVARSLDSFQQVIDMMQIAPGGRDPMPVLLISSISLPDQVIADQQFDVQVEVSNVGAVEATVVTLDVETEEGLQVGEPVLPLEEVGPDTSRTVTLRLIATQEGPSLLTLTLSSPEAWSTSRIVLVEVERSQDMSVAVASRSVSWLWPAGLGGCVATVMPALGLCWWLLRGRQGRQGRSIAYCANCGVGNTSDAKFCIKCGKALGGQ